MVGGLPSALENVDCFSMTRSLNNFDIVRTGLALIVLFAHVGALVQMPDFYWFSTVFDADFAVKGFFAISGFLVTKSYLNSSSIWDYAAKRIRRIWPAYIAAIVICFVFCASLTTLSLANYITDTESIKYIFANLAFLNFIQPTLPGVFLDNPIHAVNGALWTIKVEAMLYGCVPFLVLLWRRDLATLYCLGIVFLSISWVLCFKYGVTGGYGEEISRQFPGQLSYFGLGSFLSIREYWRPALKYVVIVIIPLLLYVTNPLIRIILEPFAYTAIVIWLGTSNVQFVNVGKYGDVSYGVYLFHFPIIQALIAIGMFKLFPWSALMASVVLSVFFALASWHFIELKVLRRSSHYVESTI